MGRARGGVVMAGATMARERRESRQLGEREIRGKKGFLSKLISAVGPKSGLNFILCRLKMT